jgi:hypothetical protein
VSAKHFRFSQINDVHVWVRQFTTYVVVRHDVVPMLTLKRFLAFGSDLPIAQASVTLPVLPVPPCRLESD